jgi:hypothetical protein
LTVGMRTLKEMEGFKIKLKKNEKYTFNKNR